MFSKANKTTRSAAAAGKPAAPSIVSRDLKVVGDLHSDGEIHVDGSVEGDIKSTVLLVGDGAAVTGEITADSVRVLGSVTGQIKARSVYLAKSARVDGDIVHEDLAVEKGAFLEGHCRRMDSAKTATGTPLNLVASGADRDSEDAVTAAGE